jgi:hypothetical protein
MEIRKLSSCGRGREGGMERGGGGREREEKAVSPS